MSYQERRALVSLISSIAIPAVYTAIMLQRYPDAEPYAPEIFHYWGSFFLLLVAVSIIARIIIAIVFSILSTIATREGEPKIMDERDRLIELQANRNTSYIFGVGVMLAMGVLVIGQPPAVMFLLLVGAGVVSDIAGEVSQFFIYRRSS
ncbi:MAG: hypothetical protein SF123_21570 [Chloroflexota bacterium]|nr:hypothetical protein [Chloroflexota bacterium]